MGDFQTSMAGSMIIDGDESKETRSPSQDNEPEPRSHGINKGASSKETGKEDGVLPTEA